jgi:RNA polymerase sigma-70 factor (ECF subfamily)
VTNRLRATYTLLGKANHERKDPPSTFNRRPHDLKENQLIRTILDGDAQAYAILVNRYQRPIFNLLLRMTGCRDTAADLAQEAFIKAYENLERFKLSEKFFPWLYAIAANLARDHWRKKQHAANHADAIRQAAKGNTEKVTAEEERLATLLDAGRLRACLERLPHDYREALILRFHEGLSMADIGKALGVSTSGAKMRVSRGMDKLRLLFNKCPAHRQNRPPMASEEN